MKRWKVKLRFGSITWGLLTALMSFSSTDASAWDGIGHEVVCQIAFQELEADVRDVIKELMLLDEEYQIFPSACKWPDQPRRRASEHYVNISREVSAIDVNAPCPNAKECLLSAISIEKNGLSSSGDPQDIISHLKYISHWIGDLHQPMHISFADDQGANSIGATLPCGGSLHDVWDSCIIEEVLGGDWREVAAKLSAEITDHERAAWLGGGIDQTAFVRWANESLSITLSPEAEYCVKVGQECWYSENERVFSGEMRVVETDRDYLQFHAPAVAQRLKMAGVRLAAILNEALDRNALDDFRLGRSCARRDSRSESSTPVASCL